MTAHSHETLREIERALNTDRLKDACAMFHDIEDEDLYAEAKAAFPGLVDLDRHGNYVGSVANENGWTP